MDLTDMAAVQAAFVEAAHLADQAVFDLLQLHLAHGYLLAGFISPLINRRDDEYGGSSENRLRFPLEVFEAVRAVWPAGKPLAVALSVDDWEPGGSGIEEAVVAARLLKERGCDLIEVLAGQTTPHSKPTYGPYFLSSYSEHLRNEVGIKTMIGGGITLGDQVNWLLAGGRADVCVLDPPHLRD
jgi:anthraniloyl-CoA monooxygenase